MQPPNTRDASLRSRFWIPFTFKITSGQVTDSRCPLRKRKRTAASCTAILCLQNDLMDVAGLLGVQVYSNAPLDY